MACVDLDRCMIGPVHVMCVMGNGRGKQDYVPHMYFRLTCQLLSSSRLCMSMERNISVYQ